MAWLNNVVSVPVWIGALNNMMDHDGSLSEVSWCQKEIQDFMLAHVWKPRRSYKFARPVHVFRK